MFSSDSLFTHEVRVRNEQDGCFRFSAAPPTSFLPRRYRASDYLNSEISFKSEQFGHPAFAQLSLSAPPNLLRGGENGAELGAFNSLINSIKSDNLITKIDEYLPFGQVPVYINVT
jgi:hypothetical protein